jgi:hypothetical protein
MKLNFKTILAVLFISLSSHVFAQSDQEFFLTIFKMEKRAYFAQNMNLKDTQFNSFWDTYSSFETERVEIGKQRIDMLKMYVEKYTTMTDADADVIMKKWLSLEKKEDALRTKYFNKMKKNLGAKTAAHFIQIDDYIQTVIKFEILDELPFIGELN